MSNVGVNGDTALAIIMALAIGGCCSCEVSRNWESVERAKIDLELKKFEAEERIKLMKEAAK